MTSPSRASRMPQSGSATITPQDLLLAVNNDAQAVLTYIIDLESEVDRLQHRLVVSREEMFTIIQISMSAVATEMSKALSVTKSSLVGIQEKFHQNVTTQADSLIPTRPRVMQHYQEVEVGSQTTGDKICFPATFIDSIGSRKGKGKLDLLTSAQSPLLGKSHDLSLPMKPIVKTNAMHSTPTKASSASGSMVDYIKWQSSAISPPTSSNATSQITPGYGLPQARELLPYTKSFNPQSSSLSNDIKAATPALAVRSDSQQNRGQREKLSTEAFIAFMVDSHKKPRAYQSTPQPPSGTEASTELSVTSSKNFEGVINAAATKPRSSGASGPFIRYNMAFLKSIGNSCSNCPNPFAGNRDKELKPIIEWKSGSNNIKTARKPAHYVSRTSSRPNIPSAWF